MGLTTRYNEILFWRIHRRGVVKLELTTSFTLSFFTSANEDQMVNINRGSSIPMPLKGTITCS